MPKRGSKSVHDNDYKWLVAMYGETCLICGRGPLRGERLEIDHISYEPEKLDEPGNKSLLCRECNIWLRPIKEAAHRKVIEYHRAKRLKEMETKRKQSAKDRHDPNERIARSFRKAVRQSGVNVPLIDDSFQKEVLEYFRGSSEMKAHARYYKPFMMLVWKVLIERGPTPEKDLLNIGSFKILASQTTLKRYLDGWCAPDRDAPLERLDSGGEWDVYFRNPTKARQINRAVKEKEGK